jgi:hypothetical protein
VRRLRRRHGVFEQGAQPEVAQVILQTAVGRDRNGGRRVRFHAAFEALEVKSVTESG